MTFDETLGMNSDKRKHNAEENHLQNKRGERNVSTHDVLQRKKLNCLI